MRPHARAPGALALFLAASCQGGAPEAPPPRALSSARAPLRLEALGGAPQRSAPDAPLELTEEGVLEATFVGPRGLLLLLTRSNILSLREPETGAERLRVARVERASASPDGRHAVVLRADASALLLDLTGGTVLAELDLHERGQRLLWCGEHLVALGRYRAVLSAWSRIDGAARCVVDPAEDPGRADGDPMGTRRVACDGSTVWLEALHGHGVFDGLAPSSEDPPSRERLEAVFSLPSCARLDLERASPPPTRPARPTPTEAPLTAASLLPSEVRGLELSLVTAQGAPRLAYSVVARPAAPSAAERAVPREGATLLWDPQRPSAPRSVEGTVFASLQRGRVLLTVAADRLYAWSSTGEALWQREHLPGTLSLLAASEEGTVLAFSLHVPGEAGRALLLDSSAGRWVFGAGAEQEPSGSARADRVGRCRAGGPWFWLHRGRVWLWPEPGGCASAPGAP